MSRQYYTTKPIYNRYILYTGIILHNTAMIINFIILHINNQYSI